MYDMDEMEIQRRVMNEVELKHLKDEKDKWHKKYNEALIEISMQACKIDQYEKAIRRLIGERDLAIKDLRGIIESFGLKWFGVVAKRNSW